MVIPVLDEAGNVTELIQRIKNSVQDAQIIFVDDGSNDGTRRIIEEEASKDQSITFVFNDHRLGHMGSYLQGIEAAKHDYIVIMDGDLQHPPEALPEFINAFQMNFKIVIGTRYVNGVFIGERTFGRSIISRIADIVLKVSVPQCRDISDPVSGFIGFTRDLVVPVSPEMTGNKLLPFLIVANPIAKIGYVPYKFGERKSGKSKIVSSGTSYIRNFLKEVRDIRRVGADYLSKMPYGRIK